MKIQWFFTARDNMRIGSLILLCFVNILIPGPHFFFLIVYWEFSMLIIGNAKRVPKKRLSLHIVRMTMYFLPYAIPYLVDILFYSTSDPITSDEFPLIYSCAFVILVYIVWLVLNRASIMLLISRQHVAFTSFIEIKDILLRVYSFIGSAICEELFFRKYILSIPAPQYILLPISIILFVMAHIALPWGAMYTKKDILLQLIIGIINGVIFGVTKTIVPGLILHLLINCTANIDLFLKFDRWYLRKEYYDQIAEELITMQNSELEL